MKKLFMFLAVAGMATFGVSCSSDDGGSDPDPKELKLSADKTTIEEGDSVTFTVSESGADLYIEGTKVSGLTHTFDTKGDYKVQAKKEGFADSNVVTVKVTEEGVDPEPSLTLMLDNEGAISVGDTVSFTVIDEKNVPVTDAQIFINDTAISGYSYEVEAEGSFTAYAEKGDVKSNEVSFEAQAPIEVPEGGFIAMNDDVKVADNATVTVDVDDQGQPMIYQLSSGELITLWQFIIEDDAKDNVSHVVFGLSLLNNDTEYGFPGDAGVSYTLLTSSTFKFDGTALDLATEFESFEGIAIPTFDHPDFNGETNHLEYLSAFGLTNNRTFVTSFNEEFDFQLVDVSTNSIMKSTSFNEFKASRKVESLSNVKKANFKAISTNVAN